MAAACLICRLLALDCVTLQLARVLCFLVLLPGFSQVEKVLIVTVTGFSNVGIDQA